MSEHRHATTLRSETNEHAPGTHVSGTEHAERGHPGHVAAEHHHDDGSHHAHMVADFRRRFWVSLVLSIPVLALIPIMISERESRSIKRRRWAADIAGTTLLLTAGALVAFWRLRF